MAKNIYDYRGLEEYLKSYSSPKSKWKANHNGRTLSEVYEQIKLNLKQVQDNVITGAMAEGITSYIGECKTELERIGDSNSDDYEETVNRFISSAKIIFLNDHGPEHTQKVIERAYFILKNARIHLSEFETFILLCAIQIHDIGNVLGRAGHERKLNEIFNTYSKNLILDGPEKRIIKSIAMAHGGKTVDGSKDTISKLCVTETIFDCKIRVRFLAALVRFADELADDSTRANRAALDLGIVGVDSVIYHDYSTALHTVKIEKDYDNNDHRIELVYELESNILSKKYKVAGIEKYLLDEIYDRTLKMEQERRYCMKFMSPCVDIGRIDVRINIYDADLELLPVISYRLEDVLYPDSPQIGHIKEVDDAIPSGEEELAYIRKREEIIE